VMKAIANNRTITTLNLDRHWVRASTHQWFYWSFFPLSYRMYCLM
jgi:hypothetical protein